MIAKGKVITSDLAKLSSTAEELTRAPLLRTGIVAQNGTMWKEIKSFVDRLGGEPAATNFSEDELRLAAAALLVHAAMVDGQGDNVEFDKLRELLSAHYGLSKAETENLIQEAREEEREAVDLYGFTSVIARHLGQDGRRQIVEMLWEMVFADGVEHEFESNLVWRTAELLGVSTNDRVALKQRVQARR